MAVPQFQDIMLPMLELASDRKVWVLADARQELAGHFKLSPEEQDEVLPSGRQTRFANRVAWAKVYLERGGLLESPRRAHFQITDRGLEVLRNPPDRISIGFLSQYPEFKEFRKSGSKKEDAAPTEPDGGDTPEEVLEAAYVTIRKNLAADLLTRVKSCSPRFFEQLVLDLLQKMGYGAAGEGASVRVGKSGDEGIDGIISEDRLGLEMVYLQAKRWEGTVGRPEIQKFVGALHGQRARKGVFMTTGTFSSGAVAYVQTIDPKVALVDGRQLAEYMIDFGLGVSLARAYELKSVDSDYFEE